MDTEEESEKSMESHSINMSMIYTAVAIMVIIILFGTAGNLMVILAVRSSKKLQTISNVFVVNLSVCDLLFVTCVLPFNIYTYLVDGWYLSEALCKAVGFLGYTLTGTTLMNITLIAFNRYTLIRNMPGYRKIFTRRNIIIMLVMSWVIPVVCLLPALLGIWGQFGYVAMMVTCNLLLNHHSQSFKLFLLLVRAGIPCGMIIYFYMSIYIISHKSHRRMHRNLLDPASYDAIAQRHEMHLTRMMAVIFVVFAVSYFPCTVTGIIDWNTILSKNFHIFCQITVYIGSGLNPIIYGLMNSQFREAYLRLLQCQLLTDSQDKIIYETVKGIQGKSNTPKEGSVNSDKEKLSSSDKTDDCTNSEKSLISYQTSPMLPCVSCSVADQGTHLSYERLQECLGSAKESVV